MKSSARILTEKFRLGLFEKPYADENQLNLQAESARSSPKRWPCSRSSCWKIEASFRSTRQRAPEWRS